MNQLFSTRMKENIKLFLPPIFLQIIKKFKRGDISHPQILFSNYIEALNQCQQNGYENEEIVKVVVEKNKIYAREKTTRNTALELSSLRTLIGVCLAAQSSRLNVLDFGGAGGYHYTVAQAALGDSLDIHWNVVETPSMVKSAHVLCHERLNFFDNIIDAQKNLGAVDLVFTSGALQSCPNPLQYLERLVEISGKYLFITRTVFNHENTEVITIQKSLLSDHGPGKLPPQFSDKTILCPLTISSKEKAEEIIQKKYDICFSIDEDRDVYTVGDKKFSMYGYFCKLKDA